MHLQSSVSPWAKPPAALGQAGGSRSNFGVTYAEPLTFGSTYLSQKLSDSAFQLIDSLPETTVVHVAPKSVKLTNKTGTQSVDLSFTALESPDKIVDVELQATANQLLQPFK